MSLLTDLITQRAPLKDIETLLKAGVEINGSITKGLKPLHYAAYVNNSECVDLLLTMGAKVNACDDIGYTPLHLAAKHGHFETARLLLNNGGIANYCENAIGIPATSKALAELTVHPLTLAIERNHFKIVELLLRRGANPNQKYFLGYEINLMSLEHVESLEMLLKYGAHPDTYSRGGLTALMKACKQHHMEAVKILLKYGATVNLQCPSRFEQKTALHYAAMTGGDDIIKILVGAGAEVNRPENFKYSPLEYAITQDKPETCQTLLELGSDVNEINGDGCSYLQIVCTASGLTHRKVMMEYLLEHGIDPNYYNPIFSYSSPSLTAIIEYFTYNDIYDYDIVHLLLKYGAKVNMTLPTRLMRIKDGYGLLAQLGKLVAREDIMSLLFEACGKFSYDIIGKNAALTSSQRDLLLNASLQPVSLKHKTRLIIRDVLPCPKPKNIYELELPAYLQKYLLFLAR